MGTYSITSGADAPLNKFACMVSFNGRPAHYHEIESLDAKEIDRQLQATADADAEFSAKQVEEAQFDAIAILNGKIVVPEPKAEVIE